MTSSSKLHGRTCLYQLYDDAVLAAFRDAGLAGSVDVPAFYTHVNHIPENQGGATA